MVIHVIYLNATIPKLGRTNASVVTGAHMDA